MRRLYMSAEGIRTSLQLKQLCWLDSGGDGGALVSDVHGNSCSLKGARLDRSAHSGGLGARVSRPAKVSTVLSMSMVDTRGGRSSTVRVESGSVSSGSKRLIQTVAFGTSSTLGAHFQSWVRAVRQRRHVDRLRDWSDGMEAAGLRWAVDSHQAVDIGLPLSPGRLRFIRIARRWRSAAHLAVPADINPSAGPDSLLPCMG